MSHRVRLASLAVVGVIVALGPMVAVDKVVRWVAIEQGAAALESMAQAMVDHADRVLDTAAGAVTSLSRGGVDECTPDNLRFVAEAVFTRSALKEIGIYDADGRIRCSNFGPTTLLIDLEPALPVKGGQLALSMVPTRVEGHMALGLRRDRPRDGGIVAIIDSSMVLTDTLHGDMRESGHARFELADGTLVGEAGAARSDITLREGEIVEITRASARYPIRVAMAVPRSALIATFAPLAGYSKIGGGVIGVVLLGFVGVAARRRPTLEAEIDAALHEGQLVPYYQPIVDARQGRVAGCEVLLRWRKPDGEMVRPDIFVPIAETTGQIVEITRRLMRDVRNDLSELCGSRPGFTISINLVAEHFASRDIVADVGRVFAAGPIGPRNLVFEITERYPLRDLGLARSVIAELQTLGCQVALDDAGTGHGGLAYMQELGMDILKIDRMFVEAIGTDAAKAPIVDALIDLGNKLAMKIVAEGVETEEQFAYLRGSGARYFQGFLFAPAMPAESFCRFVEAFAAAPAHVVHEMRPARAAA